MKSLQNKPMILAKIVVLIAIAVALYFVSMYRQKQHNQRLTIAIFEPAIHPAIQEISQGFIDKMNASGSLYNYVRYNAQGNKILMYAQAQEILQASYDLVFTIGLGCSVAIKELSDKQKSTTPIVFCAVDDYVQFNLQGPYITGVVDHTNYQRQLDITCQLLPNIRHIILLYDASQGSGFDHDKDEIINILKEKQVTCKLIEIHNLTEISQKMALLLDDADLVMILKDNTIVSGIDTIVKLCQQYQVPLLASDLNSGQKGAALAYGIYEAESGYQAALQAQLILDHHQQSLQIPVITISNMTMHINQQQAVKQGCVFDATKIKIMSDLIIDYI